MFAGFLVAFMVLLFSGVKTCSGGGLFGCLGLQKPRVARSNWKQIIGTVASLEKDLSDCQSLKLPLVPGQTLLKTPLNLKSPSMFKTPQE